MRKDKTSLYFFMLLTACFLSGRQAVAAESESLPEEILVEGDRSRINLQLQVDEAEDQFFAIFNELIDDEDFRIECKMQRVIGSLIHKRICQTKYMKDELTNSAQLYQVGVNYLADEVLKKKNRELRQKTIELLEGNAELRNAARNLNRRVEEYQDEYEIKADD